MRPFARTGADRVADAKLAATLQASTIEARKARDKGRTLVLTTVLAAIKNYQIEQQRDLTDADVEAVLRKAVKMRQDSVEQYRAGNRADLADKEQAEIEVIERYLPKQLGEGEIREAIAGLIEELGLSGKKDLGQVMKELKTRYPGQVDGRLASSIAGDLLG